MSFRFILSGLTTGLSSVLGAATTTISQDPNHPVDANFTFYHGFNTIVGVANCSHVPSSMINNITKFLSNDCGESVQFFWNNITAAYHYVFQTQYDGSCQVGTFEPLTRCEQYAFESAFNPGGVKNAMIVFGTVVFLGGLVIGSRMAYNRVMGSGSDNNRELSETTSLIEEAKKVEYEPVNFIDRDSKQQIAKLFVDTPKLKDSKLLKPLSRNTLLIINPSDTAKDEVNISIGTSEGFRL